MTETKRFVYYEHKGADYILDTPNKNLDFIEMLGDCLEAEEIVDLLNCLNDENKQLKEQLEICKDARQAYKQDWKACVSYCDTYKDEIHTLKDNIQGLIEENKVLKNNVEKLSELCVKYDFKVGRLEEENEQLKQQKDKWKQQCIHFKEMLDDMDITYLCDEWIYEELKGDEE